MDTDSLKILIFCAFITHSALNLAFSGIPKQYFSTHIYCTYNEADNCACNKDYKGCQSIRNVVSLITWLNPENKSVKIMEKTYISLYNVKITLTVIQSILFWLIY